MDAPVSEPSPSSLDDVRIAVFRQHKQLEQLLDEVESEANDVLRGPLRARGGRPRDALRILHTRFLRHLAYEELRLVPFLRRQATSTEDPAASLLEEHEEQRALVDGLLHDSAIYGDPRVFAREALGFVRAIREDMASEESRMRAMPEL